jgi:hypothetical protein
MGERLEALPAAFSVRAVFPLGQMLYIRSADPHFQKKKPTIF